MSVANIFNMLGAAMGIRTETNSSLETGKAFGSDWLKPIPEKASQVEIQAMNSHDLRKYLFSRASAMSGKKITRIITQKDIDETLAKIPSPE
jgi:hypothetical protein